MHFFDCLFDPFTKVKAFDIDFSLFNKRRLLWIKFVVEGSAETELQPMDVDIAINV